MEPSIGNIVLFTQGWHIWHPAIVTKVWEDHIVNLHVFYDEHPSDIKTWVYTESTTHNNMSWKWPDKV